MKHLSPSEGTKLAALVHRVNESLKATEDHWREANRRAKELQDSGLWKSKSNTWGEFCKSQNWNAHRLNQISNSEAFLREIEEQIGTTVPILASERAVRELRKDTPESAVKVLDNLSKNGLPVTQPNISKVRQEMTEEQQASEDIKAAMAEQTKDVVVRDETGWKIPKPAQVYWDRRKELLDLAAAVSKIRVQVQKAEDGNDLLYCGVSQRVILELNSVYHTFKSRVPYAVCTVCQGWGKQCSFCYGTGMISKYSYENQGDNRVNAAREKQVAEGTA